MTTDQTAQDEIIQRIMKEILTGLREKLTQPIIGELNRLAATVSELQEQQVTFYRETRELINRLESRVNETPLIMLTALRDAIQQAEQEG